jgi:NTP pyrophosphatase (non-canonical NTP hydrolase)
MNTTEINMTESVFDDHRDLVARLAKPAWDIVSEFDDLKAHRVHMAMGIAGEAGELLDAIKKHVIYNRELDIENVIEELGDIEFYMEGLRDQLGVSREDVLQHNINKLTTRYGKSYSDSAANARADKA